MSRHLIDADQFDSKTLMSFAVLCLGVQDFVRLRSTSRCNSTRNNRVVH